MKRRKLLCIALAATLAAGPVAAADWPAQSLQLIVQFPPGTTTDAVGRDIAARLEKQLGQPVVVVNRAGASGVVGVSALARSRPDGYTIGTINYPTLTIIPHQQKVPYDPLRDFTHLALIGPYDYGIFVRADAPWQSLEELVAHGKANPGKLTFGTLGAGTTNELVMSRLGKDLGMNWQFIPYKGDNESVMALLSGQVDVVNASANVTMPQVQAGKLRMLVSSGVNRWKALPDVRTLRETGMVSYEQNSYLSIAAPAGISEQARRKLSDALKAVLTDAAVIASFQDRYGQVVRHEDGGAYGKIVARDYEQWRGILGAQAAKP